MCRVDIEGPYTCRIRCGVKDRSSGIIWTVRASDGPSITPPARSGQYATDFGDEIRPVTNELPIDAVGVDDGFVHNRLVVTSGV